MYKSYRTGSSTNTTIGLVGSVRNQPASRTQHSVFIRSVM